MIVPLAIAAVQVAQVAPSVPARTIPIDWQALPPLPVRAPLQVTPEITDFVAAEMRSGRCPQPSPVGGRRLLRAEVAVLIGSEANVRATIPHAINCSTVEQYVAGLVASHARGNLNRRLVEEGSWYRASVLFDWAE